MEILYVKCVIFIVNYVENLKLRVSSQHCSLLLLPMEKIHNVAFINREKIHAFFAVNRMNLNFNLNHAYIVRKSSVKSSIFIT